MKKIQNLNDVVDWRMCLGCGACAAVCPEDRVVLWDYLAEGIRPVVERTDCGGCRECLEVCPAVQTDFSGAETVATDAMTREWGPVVAMWEGYAADAEIRFKGSSGGALTAIGAYCLERLGMHGVLHIAQDPEDPVRNRTRLSRTREELVAATGSRYAPASVANGLRVVAEAPSPCVVIGKPSEIAAVANARRRQPKLDRNLGVTLSFFCAESPSTAGTTALLRKLNVDPDAVGDLRYRGLGWPGHFAPVVKGEREPRTKLTYRESWGFLQAYRPWSVQLWPDGSGELADISCGDPWYEKPDGKNPGFSLIVARTARGAEIIEGAMEAGYLKLTPAENWKLAGSQGGLLEKKGSVWGRRLALRLLGLPVSRFEGLDLHHCWKRLTTKNKVRATFGTLRRVLARGLRRPLRLDPATRVPVKPPLAEPTVGLRPAEPLV